MPNVRSLLTRVARLEAQRAAPRSPIEVVYGSMNAFAEQVQTEIDAGKLDRRDWLGADGNSGILTCLRNWHRDQIWQGWTRSRVWERG